MTYRVLQRGGVNFLLTNSLPRRLLTTIGGWFSKLENPLLCAMSLWVWRRFTTLDFSDAADTRFRSLHHCFTRTLRSGSRPIDDDPRILVSPCDGIVGACGTIADGQLLQVKGSPYALAELIGSDSDARSFEGGSYVTLRLTSAMYHRFHAPLAGRVTGVTHIYGDAWNVNPPTLSRVARVFCRNERAVIRTVLADHRVWLVPVAAILVAGIKLRFLDMPDADRRQSRRDYPASAAFEKGEELGWFEHGSTIIVLAQAGVGLHPSLVSGAQIRMGRALLQLP